MLIEMQMNLSKSINGGLDALKNLDHEKEDELTQAINLCRIIDDIDDLKI